MNKEIKRRIAHIICCLRNDSTECSRCESEKGCPDTWADVSEKVEAILNLHYPCKECGGSGYVSYKDPTGINTVIEPSPNIIAVSSIHTCPTCNGTGNLLDKDGNPIKVFIRQSEEQEVPKIADDLAFPEQKFTYTLAQKNMIDAGWRKVRV